ncbi:MAG: VWA domain-containing protein [Flavobacteriales bacterium]|nr:VWA domain-containing protein [Flavobacteriales bacterium]
MRRLPVFFVVDVSESMAGEPINKVEEGIRTIITELKKDPYALETVYVSIIVFAGKAKTLVPLTDIISFYPPKFSIGAGTGYGNVLRHLRSEMESNVKQTTLEAKGDWKPIVFFMTDGNPTDNYVIDLGAWEQTYKDKTNTVIISIGDNANPGILKRISEQILAFDEANGESYAEFFKWVTASIKMQSQKVDEGTGDGEISLSGFDTSKLKKVDPINESDVSDTDEQYAIFQGKCQNTKNNYLIKYKKGSANMGFIDMPNLNVQTFRLEGSYLLDNQYQELSDESSLSSSKSFSTENLRGMPNCPACHNRFGMAICSCTKIFCLDGGGQQTCPHCGTTGNYGAGEGHIDLERQQG